MQKIRVLGFENCTFGNEEGPVQPVPLSKDQRDFFFPLPFIKEDKSDKMRKTMKICKR
jgi:hypothetical protein